MKQIILITDGCSNVGISPVVAAAQAAAERIVVNVIGVIDSGEPGELGAREIREIAEAGRGMHRLVELAQLSQTVQTMTRKTVMGTIQQVVNQELKEILGRETSLETLPPAERSRVVRVIDELAETAKLRVALLVDTSASMKPKLRAVEEAVRDLLLSLQARQGSSELAVFHFPGDAPDRTDSARLLCDWTSDLAKLPQLFYKINLRGTTPTGPALLSVVRFLSEAGGGAADGAYGRAREFDDEPTDYGGQGEDGILRDYIV